MRWSVPIVAAINLSDGNHWANNLPRGVNVTLCWDEPHVHRSLRSRWVKRVASWARHAARVWALDGTPLYNRPEDLWPVLCMLGKGKAFPLARLKVAVRDGTLVQDLTAAGLLLRRTLADVRGEMQLPPLESMTVLVPWVTIGEGARNEPTRYSSMGLRQRNGLVKARRLVTWIRENRIEVGGAPGTTEPIDAARRGGVLLWCFHEETAREAVRSLEDWGLRVGCVTGRTSQAKGVQAFADFQSSKLDWLVLTFASASGIKLTRAIASIVLELPWEPKAIEQATARMWRNGQTVVTREIVVLFDHWSDERVGLLVGRKAEEIAHAGF